MNQQNRQYSVEQVSYEQPMFEAPSFGGYDPNEVEHDMPYIPSNGQRPTQQQYQNPNQQYQQPPYQQPYQQNPQYNPQAINQQQMQWQQQAPTYGSARQNVDRMRGVIDHINGAGISTTEDGSDLNAYGLGVAKESVYNAIRVMSEVDSWIPRGKEHIGEKFHKAGAPIIKALQTYVKALEQIG